MPRLVLVLVPVLLGLGATPARAAPLARGPVVQHPTATGATILWETATAHADVLEVWPADPPAAPRQRRVDPASTTRHRVTLSGLQTSSAYRYAVVDYTGARHEGAFRTAPRPGEPFTFLVYGDCRLSYERQRAVVDALRAEPARFGVHTGDFVEDGAVDAHWDRFFQIERPLLRRLPVYPVLGNHELVSSYPRGLENFRRGFHVPEGGPLRGVNYAFTQGNARFVVLDSNAPFVGSRQTAWAEGELRRAAADPALRHLFVFVHHSPYASGPHGDNAELLRSGLVRTMAEVGVDFTFGAHDHFYERGEVDGLRYVVTAGCGAPLYKRRTFLPRTAVWEATLHHVRVTVDGDDVELTAVRPDGSLVDHLRLRKHPPAAGAAPRFTAVDVRPPPVAAATPRPPARPARPGRPEPASLWIVGGLIFLGVVAFVIAHRLARP